MNAESWIDAVLRELEDIHQRRQLRVSPQAGGKYTEAGRTILNFSSNDYLGLSQHPVVLEAARRALESFGASSTAARLVTGTLPLHEELEARLAQLKGYPQALVFGSGFLANTGIVPSVVGKDDHVFADKLVHASLIDAIVLSRATLHRFHHNDPEHLAKLLNKTAGPGRRLVITESVFSMDGDLAPLHDIARMASEHGAMLLVDEAHATGIFGPGGAGRIRELGLESAVHLSMATLSKALGGYGGFVSCSENMKALLVNRSRSFIYSTALPPAVLGAALGALDALEQAPDLGAQLLRRASEFRLRLRGAGFDTMDSDSQIIPVLVGDNAKTLSLSKRLHDEGLIAVAIRPPTVPPGSARIRLSVTLTHGPDDLEQAAVKIIAAAKAEKLI